MPSAAAEGGGAPPGDFVQFCEAARLDARCRGLDLGSLLIMPVQRVPRYALLLGEIAKRTADDHLDAPALARASEAVLRIAKDNDAAMVEDPNFNTLMAVQTQFEQGTKLNLLDWPARRLTREGELVKLCRSGPKPFYFWLFNDKLVYATPGSLGGYHLNRDIALASSDVKRADVSSADAERALQIESSQKSFVCWAPTEELAAEWLADIHRNQAELRAHYTQRTGRPAPVWTPNRAAAACACCARHFDMLFLRKHHCRACGACVCAPCSSHRVELRGPTRAATTTRSACATAATPTTGRTRSVPRPTARATARRAARAPTAARAGPSARRRRRFRGGRARRRRARA